MDAPQKIRESIRRRYSGTKEGFMAVIDQTRFSGEQDYDPAPGVDIVMPVPEGTSSRVLDGRTLKLIGALHRRFWSRRRELLQGRAQMGQGQPTAPAASSPEISHLADLTRDVASTWEGRVAQLDAIAQMVDGPESGQVVAIRGWEQTEPGVLVDGRAVPGCIFDLAVAMSLGADAFRRERNPFAVVIPGPADDEETQLWLDLSDLAHDRAGIDRGTVRIATVHN